MKWKVSETCLPYTIVIAMFLGVLVFPHGAQSSGLLYDRYVHTVETQPGKFRDVVDVFRLIGTSSTRLTASPTDKEHDSGAAVWRADGQRIAFHTTRHRETNGNTTEIYVANPDGSNPVRLTTNSNINDENPKWCGSGNKLIFARNDSIYTMEAVDSNSDGNGDNLTEIISGGDVLTPDCSPDGSKIVFIRLVAGTDRKVIVADIDGSNEVVLTTQQARCETPRWSPDGNWISYSCTHHTGPTGSLNIFRMKPVDVSPQDGEGDDREQLTNSPTGSFASNPVWKPDGLAIAYTLSTGVINAGWKKTIGTNDDAPIPGLSGRTWPTDWR